MSTIAAMKSRFQSLQGKEEDLAIEAMNAERTFIVDLNREQLYDGKDRENQDLHPTYLEDPYFDTLAEAQGYSDWKDRITPNPRRTKGVPNLFINGYFYASIDLKINREGLSFFSFFDKETDIFNKYGHKMLGLNFENRKALALATNPIFRDKMKLKTGCK